MPPNRPGERTESSSERPQEASQGEDTRYVDAYNNYMQRQAGGSQYPPATRSPFGENRPGDTQEQKTFVPGQPQGRPFTDTSFQPQGRPFGTAPEQPQQQPPGRRRPMEKERTPSSPRGITMGNGYSNRPLS
jgi:hypothetical protein